MHETCGLLLPIQNVGPEPTVTSPGTGKKCRLPGLAWTRTLKQALEREPSHYGYKKLSGEL